MDSYADLTLREFIDQAASGSPTPGGGSIAALVGTLAASMAAMTANFTIGKVKYAQHDAMMRDILQKLQTMIGELRDAIDADARAFEGISEAYKLPKDQPEEVERRKQAIDAALLGAMQVPMSVLRMCIKVAELLPSLAGAGNPNLLSDVEVAGIMIDAAARAARTNILVNSRQLSGDKIRITERESEELMKRATAAAAEVIGIISDRK